MADTKEPDLDELDLNELERLHQSWREARRAARGAGNREALDAVIAYQRLEWPLVRAAPEMIQLARIGFKFRYDSSIECPCCGDEAGWGYVSDGDPLACGCAGSFACDSETMPYVSVDDCDCGGEND